ncbi:MAG: flagellar motor switch protein FliN [Planctomycetales bacterium]|nr:flagellar motor switch protein FliN [bacterium]UNM08430.1 MAG: flagellar motor switch protein FliN [Planctomycetales bacterium]
MADIGLTQAEIDAMLNGGGDEDMGTMPAAAPAMDTRALAELERELLGSIADVMNAMTGFDYQVSNVEYSTLSSGEIRDLLGDDIIFKSAVSVDKQPLTHYYVYDAAFARSIAAALTGGDDDPAAELNEMQESALIEVVSQANGSYMTMINAQLKLATDAQAIERGSIDALSGDVVDGHLISTITLENSEGNSVVVRHVVSGELAGMFMKKLNGEDEAQQPMAAQPAPQAPAAPPAQAPLAPPPASSMPNTGTTEYSPAQFSQISEQRTTADISNLDILLDVPLQVTVELGKTQLPIRTILEYSQGSLITLDKLAGEPIDLLVNGKYFAKGEVVVIDENFGVRITSILSPADRLAQLS